MKDYEKVRGNLLDMLQDLDEHLGDIAEPGFSVSKDISKLIAEKEAHDIEDMLDNEKKDEINQVKQAIAGIDSGQYGLCCVCGGPILAAQLKAHPFADQCTQCAKQEASNG